MLDPIGDRGRVDPARSEEAIELDGRAEAEQLLQLGTGQPAGAVSLRCERLESLAREVRPASAEAGGQSSGMGRVTFTARD